MGQTLQQWLFGYLPAGLFTLGTVWFLSVILFAGIVNTGSVVGTLVCAVGAAFFWKAEASFRLICRLWKAFPTRILLILAAVVMTAAVVFASVLSVLMARQADRKPSAQTDLPVIVLGCKVNGDTPSRMLRYRLQAAAEYLNVHPDAVCVVSGGQGDNETQTEASVMKKWLVTHGIDAKRIMAEEGSANTEQNLLYSKKMLENAGISCNQAVLVTDGYHQYRASLFAKKAGIEAYAYSAKTELHLLPTYWIREWFGLCKYFVFG